MNGTSNFIQSASSIPGEGWSNGDLRPEMFPVTREGRLQLYSTQRRWIHVNQGWTRLGGGATEHSHRTSFSQKGQAIVHNNPEEEAKTIRALIAQLCETFYRHGWATGTGGGCSIRVGGPSEDRPWRVFVAPSGLQKEDMIGDDVFELDMDRNVVNPPKTPNLRQSACTPLWYVVYKHRPNVHCVIHTHSMNAQLATLLDPTETATTLDLTHLEMLKGVGNHAYDSLLQVPIIDNRPSEDLLAEQLEQAIVKYPNCNAVLVRRHGLYVWGDSWEQAKTQCESFDYLFETAVRMKTLLHMNCAIPPQHGTYRVENEAAEEEPPNKKHKTEGDGFRGEADTDNTADLNSNRVPLMPRDAKVLLLDIEGCTTSISFVKDTLFPYVLEHLDDYVDNVLSKDEDAYKDTYLALTEDLKSTKQSIPKKNATDVKWMVRTLMQQDVKVPGLKSLQGKMWKLGYDSGKLNGHVYSDVLPTLQWMKSHNVSICIYSSGSIQAQKLLFGHSVAGDLCPSLDHHFDIPTAGNKKEAASYRKIAYTLGIPPASIVFCSDAEAELEAAKEAGIQHAIMSIRPGNVPLTDKGKKEYPAIYSLLQLCGE